ELTELDRLGRSWPSRPLIDRFRLRRAQLSRSRLCRAQLGGSGPPGRGLGHRWLGLASCRPRSRARGWPDAEDIVQVHLGVTAVAELAGQQAHRLPPVTRVKMFGRAATMHAFNRLGRPA